MLTQTGGVLGIHLSHAYAHSSSICTLDFPASTLKGIDLALYHVFIAMGFSGRVRPVLSLRSEYEDYIGACGEDTEDSEEYDSDETRSEKETAVFSRLDKSKAEAIGEQFDAARMDGENLEYLDHREQFEVRPCSLPI